MSKGPRAIDSYSRIGERYHDDRNLRSLWGEMGDAFLESLTMPEGLSLVADLGCGTGSSLTALAARLPGETRLIGVEPADGMRAVAERTVAGDARISVRAGSFEALPLDDAGVDHLISQWAFHWTTDPDKAVDEMARVLRPHGGLDLLFVGRRNGGRFAAIMAEVMARHLDWDNRLASAQVMQTFDKASVEQLFARFGDALTVTESFPVHIAPIDDHLAWLVRMEGHFTALTGDRRSAFEADLRQSLAALQTDGGVPYQVHVLHVHVDGARRTAGDTRARHGATWGDLLAPLSPSARPAMARTMARDLVSAILEQPLTEADDRTGLRDLGLTSLDAVTLARRLTTALGRPIPATAAFDHPTIAALAALALDTSGAPDTPAVTPASAAGQRPSAPLRHPVNPGAGAPIAVIGLACRFPGGADTPEAFWTLINSGRDAIGPIPADRWDATAFADGRYGKAVPPFGGFLTQDPRSFDAQLFRIAPTDARSLDPQHRLLLEVSWEALERAGKAPDRLAGSRTGVWAGIATHDQLLRLSRRPLANGDVYAALGGMASVGTGRIAYLLGLAGPAVTLDTACSASLVAVHQASQALRAGEVDMALAGGVNSILGGEYGLGYAHGDMLAADGRCKSFDARADGFVRAEGCGMVVLKRLDDALADGDAIHAVLHGSAINQDGASNGLTAPSQPAQEAVIRAALAMAGLPPRAIDAVEAHGSGTSLGDLIELRALQAVFGPDAGERAAPLVAGSVKSVIGHAEAAAGIAGLMRVILQLANRRHGPHPSFRTPNPAFDWNTGCLTVLPGGGPWPSDPARPRFAGVSGFGVSGTNAHIIVGEPPAPASTGPARPPSPAGRMLALSAMDGRALRATAERMRDHLRAHPEQPVADVCATALTGRARFSHRLAVTGADPAALAGRLEGWLNGATGDGTHAGVVVGALPRLVFAFPGQGCQYTGMGRVFHETQPAFAEALDAAADALRPGLDIDPHALLFDPAHAEALNRTRYSQPAIFMVEYALAALWQAWGLRPDMVMGHSFGEFAAACVAGILSLDDAAVMIDHRARHAAALPSPGGMAAVGMGADSLAGILKRLPDVIIAADNGPAAVTLCGPRPELEALVAEISDSGGRANMLDISHPFHSPLMAPMQAPFAAVARQAAYGLPTMDFLSGVTGRLEDHALADAAYWTDQITAPVRFRQAVATLAALPGPTLVVECGPRPVLMSLARPQWTGAGRWWLPTLAPGPDSADITADSLAQLFAAGLPLDGAALQGLHRVRPVVLPTTPFQRRRHWVEVSPAGVAPVATTAPTASDSLLGPARPLATGLRLAEGSASAATPAWVRDHRVNGTLILPGAALIDALITALPRTGAATRLENVTLARPARLPEGGTPLLLQAVITADGSATLAGRPGETEDWETLATARHAPVSPPAHGPSLAEGRAPLGPSHTGHTLRPLAEPRGVALGPAFHAVAEAWWDTETVIARLSAPVSGEGPAAARIALLDGAFQTALPLLPSAGPWLPFAADALTLPATDGPTMAWALARRRSAPGNTATLVVDLTLYDAGEAIIGTVEGMMFRPLPSAGETARLYAVQWRRKGRLGAPPPARFLPSPAEVLSALPPVVLPAGAAALTEGLEAAARVAAREAVQSLDGPESIPESQRPLFTRCTALAASLPAPPSAPAIAMLDALADTHPEAEPEIALLRRAGAALADVLTGARNGLEVLFPGGDLEPLARLYGSSVSMGGTNAATAAAVEQLVSAAPKGRAVRLLEVGGGTGGTTRALAPLLRRLDVAYTFTDAGLPFVKRAEALYATLPRTDFRVLDISRPDPDPLLAGQDMILAVNVVHATPDLSATLRTLRGLLAPGGMVVLVEVARPMAWADLCFGLTDQWHHRDDRDLRPDHPLLPAERWPDQLHAAGFETVDSRLLADDGPTPNLLILARAPDTIPNTDSGSAPDGPTWIIGARDGLAGKLAGQLRATGTPATLVAPEDAIAHRLPGGPLPARLIHMAAPEPDAATGAEATAHLCRSLLAALQGLDGLCPALTLVTRGAVARSAGEPLPAPAAAPLWGLARALDAEITEADATPVRRIDLDPAWTDGEALAALTEELAAIPETEAADTEVLLRRDGRFVCRLAEATTPLPAPPEGGQLVLTAGKTRPPAFGPAARPAPGPGQVEVQVEAAGIAFPDVLQAAGLQPLERSLFGYDIAGTVSRIGPEVATVAVGDAVYGLADGGMAQYTVTDAALVLHRPDGVSAEAAAASVSAWATVRLALDGLGKPAKGERVLIHSGAGAVGSLAIQLARARGCTVLATAHPSKAAHLRRLGIACPLDSRDSAFGRQVRALTGGHGVDIILNALTTDTAMDANLDALAEGGRFIELGKQGAWTADRMAARRPDVTFHRFDLHAIAKATPQAVRPVLAQLGPVLAKGALTPPLGPCLDADEVAEGFALMARGLNVGKPVVRPPAPRPYALRTGSPLSLPPDHAVLITGGFGGLALAMADWLVRNGVRRLLLAGRRLPGAIPRPEAGQAIEALRAAGTVVATLAVDLSTETGVADALAAARALGPLGGVVHTAGVLRDGSYRRQSWTDVAAVLAPKLDAAWHLHQLTRRDPLAFFITFGSLAGIAGNAGQTAHAAASTGLDGLMHHRHSLGLPGLALDLGRVDDAGVAAGADTGTMLAARGIDGLPMARVLDSLDALLADGRPVALLAAVRWPVLASQPGLATQGRFAELAPAARKTAPAPEAPAPVPQHAVSRPVQDAEARICALVGGVLGLAADAVPPHTPLLLLGLDSLMAVDLRDRLKRDLGADIPLTSLIGGMTAAALAAALPAASIASPSPQSPKESSCPA